MLEIDEDEEKETHTDQNSSSSIKKEKRRFRHYKVRNIVKAVEVPRRFRREVVVRDDVDLWRELDEKVLRGMNRVDWESDTFAKYAWVGSIVKVKGREGLAQVRDASRSKLEVVCLSGDDSSTEWVFMKDCVPYTSAFKVLKDLDLKTLNEDESVFRTEIILDLLESGPDSVRSERKKSTTKAVPSGTKNSTKKEDNDSEEDDLEDEEEETKEDELDSHEIKALYDMGFEKETALKALRQAKGNLHVAASLCCGNEAVDDSCELNHESVELYHEHENSKDDETNEDEVKEEESKCDSDNTEDELWRRTIATCIGVIVTIGNRIAQVSRVVRDPSDHKVFWLGLQRRQKSQIEWVRSTNPDLKYNPKVFSSYSSSNTSNVYHSQKAELVVGDKIWATFKSLSSHYYPAKIVRVHKNDTYDVDFDDGDKENCKKREDIFKYIPKTSISCWTWQYEMSTDEWEEFNEKDQARIWKFYYSSKESTFSQTKNFDVCVSIGTVNINILDPSNEKCHVKIPNSRVSRVRLACPQILIKNKINSSELQKNESTVPSRALLLNSTSNKVDMYVRDLWRSRDMIVTHGSIVRDFVTFTQEKVNINKKKDYIDSHRHVLSVLPLRRLDYSEYPSSSPSISPTITKTEEETTNLDLHLRQLWNLRVIIGQIAAVPLLRPKQEQSTDSSESRKDKKLFSPFQSIRKLFRRKSKSENKNNDNENPRRQRILSSLMRRAEDLAQIRKPLVDLQEVIASRAFLHQEMCEKATQEDFTSCLEIQKRRDEVTKLAQKMLEMNRAYIEAALRPAPPVDVRAQMLKNRSVQIKWRLGPNNLNGDVVSACTISLYPLQGWIHSTSTQEGGKWVANFQGTNICNSASAPLLLSLQRYGMIQDSIVPVCSVVVALDSMNKKKDCLVATQKFDENRPYYESIIQVEALSKYPALVAVVTSHAAGGVLDVAISKSRKKYFVTEEKKYTFRKHATLLSPPKPILIGTVSRKSRPSVPSKAFAFHHVSRVPCAPTFRRVGPNVLSLAIDENILIERRALLKMFEGSAGQGLHENRVQNELAYLKSLSKRMHADGLGAEIEIQEFENQRIWTYDDVMKLLRKGAPCDAHWNGTFFHPCMYDSLVTAVKKKGPKEWTVSVLYSDGEVGNDLKPNQIRLPLESLWHNENATRTSTVKSMTLEDLLKCCNNEEKNAKEVPKNVRVIKVPKLGQLHCKNGVRVQTSYDTHARFRIRILNAAGASDWSEFSKDVFVTAGALNNQKPPRATSYSVINGDITVQWPLQHGTLERRWPKQNLTAIPAHTHEVEMMVTNGKRVSKALEMLQPGMRIRVKWNDDTGYASRSYDGVIHDIIVEEDVEHKEKDEDVEEEDEDEDTVKNDFDPIFMAIDKKTQDILRRRFMVHYDDGDKKVETLSRRMWKLLPLKKDSDDEVDEDDGDDDDDPYHEIRREFVPKLTLVRKVTTVPTQVEQEIRKRSLISTALCMHKIGEFSSGRQVFHQQAVVSRIASFLFFSYGHSGCRIKIESIRRRKSSIQKKSGEDDNDSTTSTTKFKVGDKIQAKWRGGNYYSGTISCVKSTSGASNILYDIDYDDGDIESDVAENLIRKPSEIFTSASLLKQSRGTYISFRVRAKNDSGYGQPSGLSYVYDPSKLLEAAAPESDDELNDEEEKEEEDEESAKVMEEVDE